MSNCFDHIVDVDTTLYCHICFSRSFSNAQLFPLCEEDGTVTCWYYHALTCRPVSCRWWPDKYRLWRPAFRDIEDAEELVPLEQKEGP